MTGEHLSNWPEELRPLVEATIAAANAESDEPIVVRPLAVGSLAAEQGGQVGASVVARLRDPQAYVDEDLVADAIASACAADGARFTPGPTLRALARELQRGITEPS